MLGCATLPVRSATGHRVVRVMLSESLALMARQPPQVEWSGAELAPVVELLDQNGVLHVSQPSFSSDGVDGTSLTLVIETTNESYAIELDNCPEPHVCGFLRDAVRTGLLARLPETCARRLPMCLGTCRLDCDESEAASTRAFGP